MSVYAVHKNRLDVWNAVQDLWVFVSNQGTFAIRAARSGRGLLIADQAVSMQLRAIVIVLYSADFLVKI